MGARRPAAAAAALGSELELKPPCVVGNEIEVTAEAQVTQLGLGV